MSMWGGRFTGDSAPLFRELNDSLPFDRMLALQDVRGSHAWAGALAGAGVLTTEEGERLRGALRDLERELLEGRVDFDAAAEEDIHSWVEARLTERLGALGKKLHTGRSRNDQVSTDLRLFARDACDARREELRAVRRALIALAEREADTVLPGYTHLQRAQPVLLAHWALAYEEMLVRDGERFADARRRLNASPLGSGALAGTTYPIDRHALARELGFDAPTRNSLDAVSDRDYVLELLSAACLTSLHLSRLAEDLIVYGSAEFGFVEMGDDVTSGSSLMPQKKNPDAMELVRGKCGRILGAFTTLATTLKGLPLAYNKDLQEDKEAFFDALHQLSLCLRVSAITIDGLRVHAATTADAARGGFSNATELADYLVARGIPFRDAHEITGRLVRVALGRGCALEELAIDDLRAVEPAIESDVYDWLTLERGLERRDVLGGTAPRRVAAAVAEARARLESA